MAVRSKARPKAKALSRYVAKRDFSITPEPKSGGQSRPGALQFVIQKHWASRLHYDLRLEIDGTMKSWAVPKGPSLDPAEKRMAVHVEDHPISYNDFEGQIPEKQYGAGKVIIWDKGTWTPIGDAKAGYRAGHLKFNLQGVKLKGAWVLVKIKARERKQDAWLLIKEKDEHVRAAAKFSVTDALPDSVAAVPGADSARARAPAVSAAKKRALPASLKPLLATLVDAPPPDPIAWIYEVKFDGYRILARVDRGKVQLITRTGHDWTAKLPHLARALQSMSLRPGWLDGEIVMLTESGSTSFQSLQNAFDSTRTDGIVYFLFDLPYYDGMDLTATPLVERRALLQSILEGAPASIRFSEAFDTDPDSLVSSACKLGLEGIIGKRRLSGYSSRRSPDWIKLKCGQRQEFVVAGWTEPKGSRKGLGALLLGVNDDAGKLRYAGKVGSGFNEQSLRQIHAQLQPLATAKSPLSARVAIAGPVHWVKPRLVAEVTFSEWTGDGRLRHPVFHAMRTDKPAKAIRREDPVAALGPDLEEPAPQLPARLKVSHPDRVVDSSTGLRKIDIIRYYAAVGELMMPHLAARPASLVKAPRGISQPAFFQKHAEGPQMPGVAQLSRKLDPDHPPYLEVITPEGLLSAAQMNVIEFHTWNATRSDIARPDRIIFDLDPGKGAPWSAVRDGAELMRTLLQELGLSAFLKTSGGKGLHVVTPIVPQFDWPTVKGFSETVVLHMAESLPKLFVAKSGPGNRVGKVFIDYLRNGFGATTVCAWSARARPGMGISVPVAWSELSGIANGAQWSIGNATERLSTGNSPWNDYDGSAKSIESAMRDLGLKTPVHANKKKKKK